MINKSDCDTGMTLTYRMNEWLDEKSGEDESWG